MDSGRPVAHFVVLPNCHEDETILRELLKILVAFLRQRNTCVLCWSWSVSWRHLATSFEDTMANYHPQFFSSVTFEFAFDRSPAVHQARHFRVPAFDQDSDTSANVVL